jgi:hypothetical protein
MCNALVRCQSLTATSMKMSVFWDVAPCSLVGNDRRFRGSYCLHHQGDHPDRDYRWALVNTVMNLRVP